MIRNSMIAANRTAGDGPDLAYDKSNATLDISFSLVGDNTGNELPEAPIGMPDAKGNFIGDPNGMGVIDPQLSPRGSFGGPTQTHALLPGSPAIDIVAYDLAGEVAYDQRGAPFTRVSGDRMDIRAFESQIAPVDFVDDGQLDCDDVDALVAAIVAGDNPQLFDLTADALVDEADLDVWLNLAGHENQSSYEAYLPGDANLDGKVDAADLNVVGLNWRQYATGWYGGDFTADGVADAEVLKHWP